MNLKTKTHEFEKLDFNSSFYDAKHPCFQTVTPKYQMYTDNPFAIDLAVTPKLPFTFQVACDLCRGETINGSALGHCYNVSSRIEVTSGEQVPSGQPEPPIPFRVPDFRSSVRHLTFNEAFQVSCTLSPEEEYFNELTLLNSYKVEFYSSENKNIATFHVDGKY